MIIVFIIGSLSNELLKYLLVVLDVVHDLVDAVLMSSEEGSGHNWVEATLGKFVNKSCYKTFRAVTTGPRLW